MQDGLCQKAIGVGGLDANAIGCHDGRVSTQRESHAELVQEATEGSGGLWELLQRQECTWGQQGGAWKLQEPGVTLVAPISHSFP